ncbi:MAG: hypothetical protein Q4P13_11145 [Psychrobacter sp.]|nr:hypothetical protein [Psychrobacter sp.]
MKKRLKFICLLFPCIAIAQVPYTPPLVKANCETLQLSMGSSVAKEIRVVPFWKNPAQFPDPPTSDSAGKSGEPYRIECPELSVYDDGNVVEIKAGK